MGLMLEAVLFDAGYTLVFPDYEFLLSVLRRIGRNYTVREIREREGQAREVFDSLAPSGIKELLWFKYYVRVFELLGLNEDEIKEVLMEIRDYNARGLGYFIVLNDEAPPVLRELKERKLKLGVVSNSDGRIRRVLEHVGIAGFFDIIVDSSEIGVEKPAPEIFEYAARALSIETKECIYIGDFYYLDYLGSMKAGMIPVLYDPVDAYKHKKVRRIKKLNELIPIVDRLVNL